MNLRVKFADFRNGMNPEMACFSILNQLGDQLW